MEPISLYRFCPKWEIYFLICINIIVNYFYWLTFIVLNANSLRNFKTFLNVGPRHPITAQNSRPIFNMEAWFILVSPHHSPSAWSIMMRFNGMLPPSEVCTAKAMNHIEVCQLCLKLISLRHICYISVFTCPFQMYDMGITKL